MKTLRIYGEEAVWLGSDIKDFVGLLTTLEPRTYWRISPVPGDRDDYFDATGASSEKLEMLAKSGEFITGEALAELAQETRQVIWGQFVGHTDLNSAAVWVTVRAIDSSFFEVITSDENVLSLMKSHFTDVRPYVAPWGGGMDPGEPILDEV